MTSNHLGSGTGRPIEHRGCYLAYSVRGEGPPVLFIQGVGVHGNGWQPQVDELSARYCCLALDNRGMGRSQPIGETFSVAQMADDTRVLMDAQGWEAVHVAAIRWADSSPCSLP